MAHLNRTPKSGTDWTTYDLDSCNISLVQQTAHEFFGLQVLPEPTVDAELLQNLESNNMQSDENAELINLLDLARTSSTCESGPVVDFAYALFRTTGYVRRDRVARRRKELRRVLDATTDVCVVDRERNDEILVLLQEDRFGAELDDDEPIREARAQLVANALAAFAENNVRREAAGRAPLQSKVVAGITMTGTGLPKFFKIPVTQELVGHVGDSDGTSYPPTPTIVTFCVAPVPRPGREGMKPLDNRREILRCYEAFKAVVGI